MIEQTRGSNVEALPEFRRVEDGSNAWKVARLVAYSGGVDRGRNCGFLVLFEKSGLAWWHIAGMGLTILLLALIWLWPGVRQPKRPPA